MARNEENKGTSGGCITRRRIRQALSEDEVDNLDEMKAVDTVETVDIKLTNQGFSHVIMISDFNLNRSKAIQKKIEAAKRPSVEYVHAKGGNHVVTFNTGTYEVLKPAIFEFYRQEPNIEVKVRKNIDSGEKAIIDMKLEILCKKK